MVNVFAHAFGERYELPISLSLFLIGGAVIVFVSFLLVIRNSAYHKANNSVEQLRASKINPFWSSVSFLLLALSVLVGIFGTQEIAENILPTLFWLVLWIAVPLSCGLVGNWTESVNPFANIAKITANASFRKALIAREQPLEWPRKLGWWLTTAMFFVLAAGELIFSETATLPAVIGCGLAVYFLASGLMGLLYGENWIKRGEMFAVLFSTWGKLGYLRFGASGKQGFAGGLSESFEAVPSRTIFVLLLLISVSFDGLISTSQWGRFRDGLPSSAQGDSWEYKLIALAVFIVIGLLIWGIFSAFAAWTSRLAGTKQSAQLALSGLLPSLVPISFGYLLAHNLEYLITNGQLLFPLIGNPSGQEGWPIHLGAPFNDGFEVNIHVLPSSFYWYIAVIAIIAVHVMAVILAHKYLSAQTKDAVKARRSEYPWIFIMILYTMFSLWLLAQPLTKENHGHNEAKSETSQKVGLNDPATR